MGLTKYKLGDLIEQRREKYDNHSDLPIRGVSRDGFMDAKQPGADLSLYNVFYYGDFVFNPARMELNSIAYNSFYEKAICSSLYEIFYVSRKDILLPEYLNMYVKRDEFARICEILGWGSAREYCRVSNLVDIEITLPDVAQQQKYVDVYRSLINNLSVYQSKADELKTACIGYIEDLRRKMPCERIGGYIRECNERNVSLLNDNVLGVESSGNFTETRANTLGLDFSNYKIVKNQQFAYNPSRINLGSIALRKGSDCIVSPMYIVFEIIDTEQLIPEYLMLWFSRSEFLRSTLFFATGSVRDTFDFTEMCDVRIPIPSRDVQRAAANIYECYIERQRIASRLKEQINKLSSILLKGSLQQL